MTFKMGDEVRAGTRVGTVTDIGTILIQVTTNEGTPRLVCRWELVRVQPSAARTSCRNETRSRR